MRLDDIKEQSDGIGKIVSKYEFNKRRRMNEDRTFCLTDAIKKVITGISGCDCDDEDSCSCDRECNCDPKCYCDSECRHCDCYSDHTRNGCDPHCGCQDDCGCDDHCGCDCPYDNCPGDGGTCDRYCGIN